MGSVNYIFANVGQFVQIIVQTLDSNGFPLDLDSRGNWLDGYGYLIDGYWSDAPDGYYADGYQDGYAGPNDGYYVPVVQKVVFPDLSLATNYPRPMSRIGVGLYSYGLQLPSGITAVGTYVASVSWTERGSSQPSDFESGYVTLIDGYALVPVPGGLPEDAVIVTSREISAGVIGEVTVVPGSQTTTQFALISSSSYDNSVIAWSSSSASSSGYISKWETYSINAARPFGITSVTPI